MHIIIVSYYLKGNKTYLLFAVSEGLVKYSGKMYKARYMLLPHKLPSYLSADFPRST